MYQLSQLSWYLIGDINNILSYDNKRGGGQYLYWLIQGFRQVVEDYQLAYIALKGYLYAWERGHGTAEWIEIRLGGALVSSRFNYFKNAKLTNLEVTTSYHSPIMLEPNIITDVTSS